MRKTLQTTIITMSLAAAQLLAGGFFVELGNPAANPQARAKNAVLVARIAGCHDPAKAAVAGTAEGIVNGRAQSVPLKLIPLGQPGMFAVQHEWPAEGVWVVKLIATTENLTTSVVVRMNRDGFDRASAKYFHRLPDTNDVQSVLSMNSGG